MPGFVYAGMAVAGFGLLFAILDIFGDTNLRPRWKTVGFRIFSVHRAVYYAAEGVFGCVFGGSLGAGVGKIVDNYSKHASHPLSIGSVIGVLVVGLTAELALYFRMSKVRSFDGERSDAEPASLKGRLSFFLPSLQKSDHDLMTKILDDTKALKTQKDDEDGLSLSRLATRVLSIELSPPLIDHCEWIARELFAYVGTDEEISNAIRQSWQNSTPTLTYREFPAVRNVLQCAYEAFGEKWPGVSKLLDQTLTELENGSRSDP